MTPAEKLRARAKLARFCDVAAALQAAASEANVLAWLARRAERAARREARRGSTATARRLELLDWLAALERGEDLGPCQGFEVGAGRRALKASRGLAAAAARLTGESVDAFRDAQRERRRLGARVRR